MVGTFLVTGGAGFIGSHVVDELLADGHAVRIVDALDPAAHDGPPGYLDDRADLVVADLCDTRAWSALLDGVDGVCHQAAKVGLGLDLADVGAYVHANDAGTAALLQALHERSFAGRLVLASSMVVYGEGRYRCGRHGVVRPGPRAAEDLRAGRFEPPCPLCGQPLVPAAVPEDAPLDPRSVYAVTKLTQEHLTSVYARLSGVPVTALRYHNVYGPRMPRDTPYAGVASIFLSACAAGRAPRVFEDGGQLRDFVHVSDVAHANVLALTAREPVTGAFNVASGDPRTIGEMASALVAAFDDMAAGAGTARQTAAGAGTARQTAAGAGTARQMTSGAGTARETAAGAGTAREMTAGAGTGRETAAAPGVGPPEVTGEYRLGDVRHVFASAERAAAVLGFRAQVAFADGMRAFASAPLRRPAALAALAAPR